MTGIVGDFRHTAGKIPAGNSNPPGGNLPNAVASSVFVKKYLRCTVQHQSCIQCKTLSKLFFVTKHVQHPGL